ncbi:hypothetical protein SK128_025481, partial [Halocaridina rubra]
VYFEFDMAGKGSGIHKQVVLALEKKMNIIRQGKSKECAGNIAHSVCVHPSTIHSIIKNAKALESKAQQLPQHSEDRIIRSQLLDGDIREMLEEEHRKIEEIPFKATH